MLEIVWHAQSFERRDDKTVRDAIDELGGPFTSVVVTVSSKLGRAQCDAIVASAKAATKIEPSLETMTTFGE